MPQRSNEFQRLVETIHRLYAPVGAEITPSAMVKPKAGGPAREIDVLIRYKAGLSSITIAIEARDLSRPLDVTGIEEYIGKYNSNGGIAVSKVIIVARFFSQTARNRAELLGFSLQTLNEMEKTDSLPYFAGPNKEGRWTISKGLGNRVDVKLFDKKGIPRPLQSTITPRTAKTSLGTAVMWARQILDKSLGQLANELFEKHSGQMVHVVINLHFRDHKARINRENYNLGKLAFDFGERAIIPPTRRETFQWVGDEGETKTIVREVGCGPEATIAITYEETKDSPFPMKLHVETKSASGGQPEGKKVVVDITM